MFRIQGLHSLKKSHTGDHIGEDYRADCRDTRSLDYGLQENSLEPCINLCKPLAILVFKNPRILDPRP